LFGVAGILLEAANVADSAGQLGKDVVPAVFLSGELGGESFPYSSFNLLKSSLVVTVLPSWEMVTMPN
jgi:hypothetical protein